MSKKLSSSSKKEKEARLHEKKKLRKKIRRGNPS